MRYFTLVIILLFSSSVFADRRVDLIGLLNEEIAEVVRLNKQVASKNPTLLLRMAELHLERARVYKEIENEKYLDIPVEKRANADKKKVFVKSNEDFIKAQKICYFIVKNFKRFKGLGDVYYILAFNAKEFGDDQRAHKYFVGAVKIAPKDSTTGAKSKLALAELYYNRKDYQRAIPYYEDSIKSRSSRWWTKDAFNLAWCYFRANKLNNAITLMREVERLSRDPKYVDLSKDAGRDLALFYTEAGRVNEAVAYYKTSGKDVADNFIRVAKNLISQKKFTPAEKVLLEAKSQATSEAQIIIVNQMLLETYEYMEKPDMIPSLVETQWTFAQAGKLNDDQRKFIIYVVDRFAGVYQKQVVSKRYAHQPELNKKKGEIAIKLFDLKAKIQPEHSHIAYLLAAETYYSLDNCNGAISYYEKSSVSAKEKNDAKIRSQANNGIMVCVGDEKLRPETKEKYLIPVYLAYLNENPSSEKAQKIYQRLFVEQMKKNDLSAAEQTFEKYRKYFPRDTDQQEAFVARLVDAAEKTNNTQLANKWLTKIYNNEVSVSPKFRESAKAKLMKVQFAQIGQQKDNVSVLKGYLAIFNNKENTKDTRAIAAYNIAAKYFALGYFQKTYIWVEQAISYLNDDDFAKFRGDIMTMIGHVNDGLEYTLGAKLLMQITPRLCRISKEDGSKVMLSSITLLTAEGKYEDALDIFSKIRGCTTSDKLAGVMVAGAKVYLDSARFAENHDAVERFVIRYGSEAVFQVLIMQAHFELAEHYLAVADNMAVKKHYADGLALYDRIRRSGIKVPLSALEWVAKSKITSLRKAKDNFSAIQLSFPEDRFQRDIKLKIKMLDEIVTKGKEVIELNAPAASMVAREYMIDAHLSFADEVDQFMPPGKSEEYVTSFRSNMQTLTSPLKRQAKELEEKLRQHVVSTNALSARNKKVLLNAGDKLMTTPAVTDFVLMERNAK